MYFFFYRQHYIIIKKIEIVCHTQVNYDVNG